MTGQEGHTTLGDLVVRAALIEARRHRAAGATPDEAAARACCGAWAPFRRAVARRLRDEDGTGDPSCERRPERHPEPRSDTLSPRLVLVAAA
jgi:hypothetical protein